MDNKKSYFVIEPQNISSVFSIISLQNERVSWKVTKYFYSAF